MRRVLGSIGVAVAMTVAAPAGAGAVAPPSAEVAPCADSGGPYWPGWDIARGVALLPPPTPSGSPRGGYVLDGWGGLHPFGWISGAGAPPATYGPWWPGWDIARGVATMPDGSGGYVVDGWGGIHPFAVDGRNPPAVVASAYWPGWDIVRGIAIQPDGGGGYVLDAWGGQHPFSIGGVSPPRIVPGPTDAPYRPGVDWARGLARPFPSHPDTGVILGATGAMNPFGTARQLADWTGPSWPGWDIARGIAASGEGDTCALVVDGVGGLHVAWPRWLSPPPPVTDVHAGPGGGSGEVEVVWRGDARATGYRVSRATAPSGPFTTSADFDVATGSSTRAPGVTNVFYSVEQGFAYVENISGAQRYFRVTAYNAAGDATPSAVVCGAPVGYPAC